MPVNGDLLTPRLDVEPSGADTQAALVVIDPDDGRVTLGTRYEQDRAVWFGDQIRLGEVGEWRLWWKVTGTGADEVTQLVQVDPGPGDIPEGFSYASTADLVKYTGQPLPADARRSLINASREIDRITVAARYAVDHSTGKASDPRIRRALADATCELIGWWSETGMETGGRGLVTNASIAGVSLGFGGGGGGSSANTQAGRVGPKVWTILINANLVGGRPLYG